MSNLLQQGIGVFRSGNREEARKIFISYIKQNPQSERGWEWLYNASRSPKERIHCLEQILSINPGNEKARRLLDQFLDPSSQTQVDSPNTGSRNDSAHIRKNNTNLLLFGTVGAFLILVFCVGLEAVFFLFPREDNRVANNCFDLALNGKQLCFPSQALPQATSYPVLLGTTPSLQEIAVFSATPTVTFTPTLTLTPSATSTPTVTFAPTNPSTSTPYARLAATFWRKWPVVPEFSTHAQQILYEAMRNPGLDPHVFSKVGDCQMTAGTFLAGYANGIYSIPDGMDETVQWFSGSMIADDITAVNGYGINTILDPAFGLAAGYNQCLVDETPLDCELRTRRPMIVLIGMGTNWIPHGEVSFEKHLREVVDTVLKTGALPILATKADNVEGDWKLNEVIAKVAYEYDLPLVNVWRSVQDLPHHGLERAPRQVYLTGDGWMKRNVAWLVTLDKVHQILGY
jgi:hypothetical protein